MMMLFYSAQIYLRKILNCVNTDLYKGKSMHNIFHLQEVLSMNLQQWRSKLPEVMQWKDSDPPSKDINVARLRAKYYEACYVIHRPLLYHALHFFRQPASVGYPTAAPGPVQSSSTAVGGRWTSYTYRDLPIKLQQACKVCIHSAILSTEAFDGIEGRPVVTNIFGTAHAYDPSSILSRLTD